MGMCAVLKDLTIVTSFLGQRNSTWKVGDRVNLLSCTTCFPRTLGSWSVRVERRVEILDQFPPLIHQE